MKIKQILLAALFFSLSFTCCAQDFNVSLRIGERSATVDAVTINDELVFLDRRGNILPDDYNGPDYEYYGRFDRDELQGKIKSINGIPVKYYDVFDRDELRGKVKSIGDITFTYYDIFDRDELRGKLKSVGGIALKYYDVFDRDELRGKLKSIGSINIAYYDTFDGERRMGRVKAVKGKTANVSVSFARGGAAAGQM
ncbi:hypothetical protein [Mucilaginibacter pedocola]|uniref:Uncharacterized protein n=1 Tax=Mucilaginibacter pedocola TaxID=1792845 RepID=A0A1S9PJY2_9SPHI|nr:hypothetical protein [Mucilaginibacter pedocola]OOQ61235.1 hypothetical protein BC343_19800 [Mucilaginibacter pedocola]